MKILVSDLDNTLIYSYKRKLKSEMVLVESDKGKQLSFMTAKSYRLLSRVNEKLLFVPVSTRSVSQYRRIIFNEKWRPRMALVSNGGTLIRDGREDPVWKRETMQMIKPSIKELEQAEKILAKDSNRIFEVRRVDDVFVFTKSSNPGETIHMLSKKLNLDLVDYYENGSKIYVLPKELTKGRAVQRLKVICKGDLLIAAGDSMFDISMIQQADLAYCPNSIKEKILNYNGRLHTTLEQEILSDVMLEGVCREIEK